jgi:hypothetical protein
LSEANEACTFSEANAACTFSEANAACTFSEANAAHLTNAHSVCYVNVICLISMAMNNPKDLSPDERKQLLSILKSRFVKNMKRHKDLDWTKIQSKLESNPSKLWSLSEMERTGGEPDVIDYNAQSGEFLFCDCSAETPKDRRNLCYDQEALAARKQHKPSGSAMEMASKMGIELLSEEQYRYLQKKGPYDLKTSSWINTPEAIRKLGGALFGDCRYNHVFIYHNGAESYYSSRGFRGMTAV